MAKQVQELIDKIKQEGFEAAQEKAQILEVAAQEKAKTIVQKAEAKAKEIIDKAQNEAKKREETSQAAVTQASRDILLDLRKEIEKVLSALIRQEVKEALSPEALGNMIQAIVQDFCAAGNEKTDIKVVLNKKDLEQLKKGVLLKLQDKLKNKITLETSEEVSGGFTISFDSGKSSFDFTDQSLAEYLSAYLNPEVSQLLKNAL